MMIKQEYKESIIKYCIGYKLDGLPGAGELLYREISLGDIYLPINFKSNKDTNLALYNLRNNELWKGREDTSEESDNLEKRVSEIEEIVNNQLRKMNQRTKSVSTINAEYSKIIELLDQQIIGIEKSISTDTKENYFDKNDRLLEELLFEKDYRDNVKSSVVLTSNKPISPVGNKRSSRHVILSNPGFGKTTLIKRLALAYSSNDNDFLSKNDLPHNLFPVILFCRTLNDFKEDLEHIKCFEDFIVEMTRRNIMDLGTSEVQFRKLIAELCKTNDLILFIDGFDEIFDQDTQNMFSIMLKDYLEKNPQVNLLLTSRTVTFAYGKNRTKAIAALCGIEGIQFNEIEKLNKDEISRFCRKWYSVIFPNDIRRLEEVEVIINQINSTQFKYISNMVSVPLYLTNILCLTRISGSLPKSKIEFYEQYMTIALNWHARGLHAPLDVLKQLAYIASYMMKNNLTSILQESLVNVLKKCYQDLDGMFSVNKVDDKQIEVFIDELEERACILQRAISVGDEVIYEFTHMQLQEYLTAYAILHGCSDENDNGMMQEEILAKHYKDANWREIIILVLLQDSRIANAVVQKLIDLVEEDFYVTSLLFEILINYIPLKKERRELIFKLLYEDQITDYQIVKIRDYIFDLRSEEFVNYIEREFERSIKDVNVKYCFVYATIEIYRMEATEQNPYNIAQELYLLDDNINMLKGLYIMVTLSWCKYNNIRNAFNYSKYLTMLNEKSMLALRKRIENQESPFEKEQTDLLKDLILSGSINNQEFYNIDLMNKMAELALVLFDNEKKKIIIENIFSMCPIIYRTLAMLMEVEVSNEIKEYYRKKYAVAKYEEKIFDFVICVFVGVFGYDLEKIVDEFTVLEGYYSLNEREKDGSADIRLQQVKKDIGKFGDSLNDGYYAYQEGDYDKAFFAFLYEFKNDNDKGNNNLAYMLRRNENQTRVMRHGTEYTAPMILENGVSNNDNFALANMALVVIVDNDCINIRKGMEYIDKMNHLDIDDVFRWWKDRADLGEIEGYIMIYMLYAGNLIEEFYIEEIEDIVELKAYIQHMSEKDIVW